MLLSAYATFRYWISQPAAPTTNPTLVLLHGATLDHHAWDRQVAALQDRFPLVTPDLRGHGASTGRFDFTAAVHHIEALLEVLPADQIVLVGPQPGRQHRPATRAQEQPPHSGHGDRRRHLQHRGTPPPGGVDGRRRAACPGGGPRTRIRAASRASDRHRTAGTAVRPRSEPPPVQPRDRRHSRLVAHRRPPARPELPPAGAHAAGLRRVRRHRRRRPRQPRVGATGRAGRVRRDPRRAGHTSNLDNPEAFTKILEAFLRRVLPLRSGATAGAGSPDVEASAERLYARFGGRPWQLLPEPTREHFRGLVVDGIDGAGRPLRATG